MKKRELIHYHSLLGTVARDLVDRGVLDESALEPYRELGVSPMAMRGSRDDHEEAVIELAATLAAAVEESDAGRDTDRQAVA